MDDKLREAKLHYKNGERKQAYNLLLEIIKQDPYNSDVWYRLALCESDIDKKNFFLDRALHLDPSNQLARQYVEQLKLSVESINSIQIKKEPDLLVNKKFFSGNRSVIISFGLIGIVILLIIMLFRKEPYQPNADDAFSHAAGYALHEMYARNPGYYGCVENEKRIADTWYKIQVSDLGNGRYYVIGATKAIEEDCWYGTGYFATTIYYDSKNNYWKLDGDIYHSNSCLTLADDSGGCTVFDLDWTPDANWKPPE